MHIPVCGSRLSQAICIVVCLLNDIIDLTLLCSELSAAWICTGEVRSIMSIALCTGINYEQTAGSDDLMMAVIVKSLTVLRKDCSE